MKQNSQSEQLKAGAAEIVRKLREQKHQAYFAGGCVRDLLLRRQPADFDVATDARPDQVMCIFPETYAVGAQFGVVLVPVRLAEEQKATVEVATFRNDGIYSDGRHPSEVQFSKSPQEDVQRRDFTINGMMLDPFLHGDAAILDFVGGREDLKGGIIRAIGDPARRFAEDKLRMLRAVRFAARFRYTIEFRTFSAIRQLASQIHQVSKERVRDEILKMLIEGHARAAFELLSDTGLLVEILPEVAKMKGVPQPPEFHPEGDVWIHTLRLLEQLPENCSRTLALGALLHDVGKPATYREAPDRIRFDGHVEVGVRMAEEICRRFRLSNEEREQVLSLVANHMRFGDVRKMKEATLKRFFRLKRFDEHLALHRIDCTASHGDLSLYEYAKQKYESSPAEEIKPRPLMTGRELIAAGYKPGPQFKDILTAVEDAQMEGTLKNRQDAMDWVRANYPHAP